MIEPLAVRYPLHQRLAGYGAAGNALWFRQLGLTVRNEAFGPWLESEIFLNWGLGFHSNDARGVTRAVDPATPLVRSNGSEIGLRSRLTDRWSSTVALWYLELDSELVFVGDEGTTEPAGASHRGGIEWSNTYVLNDWTTFDLDYAYVRPRFIGGERIPNAVENVLTSGVTVQRPEGGLYGTARLRHYGPAALIEDNSARSGTTTLVNFEIGYQWERARLAVEVFNVFDVKQNDIVYFYESQPAGLPAAEDYHFHPVVPASARAYFMWFF